MAICRIVVRRKKFPFYCVRVYASARVCVLAVAEEVFVSGFSFLGKWNWNSSEILCVERNQANHGERTHSTFVMFKSDTPKWQSQEISLQHPFFNFLDILSAQRWVGTKVKNKTFLPREYFAMSSAFIIFYETFFQVFSFLSLWCFFFVILL